jgi:hypothetical protein
VLIFTAVELIPIEPSHLDEKKTERSSQDANRKYSGGMATG